MSRSELREEYRQADYLLLHLNDFPSLEKVLPSKLFEYAATGKPVVAGVRGHAKRFITSHVEGAAVFEPGHSDGMVEAVQSLAPTHWERARFKREFARTHIMDRMAYDILNP
jgi:glycosyltransferase involved in cell wall biosynthesis